jgi:hypothetical protein
MTKAATPSRGDVTESPGDMPMVEKRKGSYKTTATGGECDGGTKDSALASVASKIYQKAVDNGGAKGDGDHAFHER